MYIFSKKKILINFLNIYFFLKISDTEYRKLLSGSYEYEYEEYPNQDNYRSNNPQDTKTTSIGSTKKRLHLGQRHIQLQGPSAHIYVEFFVHSFVGFFYFFCNCARGLYYSGYVLMSCDFWGML